MSSNFHAQNEKARTIAQITKLVWEDVIEPASEFNEKWLQSILTRAQEIRIEAGLEKAEIFTRNGIEYYPDTAAPQIAINAKMAPIQFQLYDEMDKQHAESQALSKDWQLIKQTLGSVLTYAKEPQDFRDLMPDSFIKMFTSKYQSSSFFHKPRAREIQEILPNSFLLKNYTEKIIPLIEYYIAMRLVHQ